MPKTILVGSLGSILLVACAAPEEDVLASQLAASAIPRRDDPSKTIRLAVNHNCEAGRVGQEHCQRVLTETEFDVVGKVADAVRVPAAVLGQWRTHGGVGFERLRANLEIYPGVFGGKLVYEPASCCPGAGPCPEFCDTNDALRNHDVEAPLVGFRDNNMLFNHLRTSVNPEFWAMQTESPVYVVDGPLAPGVNYSARPLSQPWMTPYGPREWRYFVGDCQRRRNRDVAGPFWTFDGRIRRTYSDQIAGSPYAHNQVMTQGSACVAVGWGRPFAASVMGQSIATTVQDLEADGLWTDEIGGNYHRSQEVGSCAPVLCADAEDCSDNPSPEYDCEPTEPTWAVPWPGENEPTVTYVLSHGEPTRSHIRRLPYDRAATATAAQQAFASDALRFARSLSIKLQSSGYDGAYMPNFNMVNANLNDTPADDDAMFLNAIFAHGAYFEKWQRPSFASSTDTARRAIEVASYVQSRGRPAVLTAQILSYNDTNAFEGVPTDPDDRDAYIGERASHYNLERALVRYLFAAEPESTLKLELERYRTNVGPDNYRSASVLANVLGDESTWLRTILDLRAGAPRGDFAARSSGAAEVVFRRFDNVIAIANAVGGAVRVRLPDDGPYTYVRMRPFRGRSEINPETTPFQHLPLPLSVSRSARFSEARLDTCIAGKGCDVVYGGDGEHLVTLDTYARGSVIFLRGGESLLLFRDEALPFDQMRMEGNVAEVEQRYLSRCEGCTVANPITPIVLH